MRLAHFTSIFLLCASLQANGAPDHRYVAEIDGTYFYVRADEQSPLKVRFRGVNGGVYTIEWLGTFGVVDRVTCQMPCHSGNQRVYINDALDHDYGVVDLDAFGPVSSAVDDMIRGRLKVSAQPWPRTDAQKAPYVFSH